MHVPTPVDMYVYPHGIVLWYCVCIAPCLCVHVYYIMCAPIIIMYIVIPHKNIIVYTECYKRWLPAI